MSDLDELIAELERAAARLRSGELEADEAAELVERCAQLAGEVGAALDDAARAAAADEVEGQERLL